MLVSGHKQSNVAGRSHDVMRGFDGVPAALLGHVRIGVVEFAPDESHAIDRGSGKTRSRGSDAVNGRAVLLARKMNFEAVRPSHIENLVAGKSGRFARGSSRPSPSLLVRIACGQHLAVRALRVASWREHGVLLFEVGAFFPHLPEMGEQVGNGFDLLTVIRCRPRIRTISYKGDIFCRPG
jgi:hypothetical protein